MSPPPALGELLDLLRAEGFAIGIDDHVRVGKLLAVDAAWSEDQLRIAIRSLVAKDAQARAAFDGVWTRLFGTWAPSADGRGVLSTTAATVTAAAAATAAVRPSARPRWWRSRARPRWWRPRAWRVAMLGAGVLAAVIGWWRWPEGASEPRRPAFTTRSSAPAGSAAGARPAGLAGSAGPARSATGTGPAGSAVGAGPAGSAVGAEPAGSAVGAGSAETVTTAAADDALPLAEAPQILAPPPPWRERASLGVLFVGGVLLAAATAIGAIRARRRRRFLPGPWRYTLRVPEASRPVLNRDAIADGAAHLTWQADHDAIGELDIERTVHATVASGGAPVLVSRPPPAAPRYLVLEDTEGGSARWRFLYDELLRGLACEGVDLARYTFAGDPSSCTSLDGGTRCELRGLVEHCDALIVIGNGNAAFDPLEGTPAPWLQTLRHVPQRLWLNPVPVARWSRGARLIARDTPMRHAIARGLAALKIAGAERGQAYAASVPWVIERAPASSTGFGALQDHVGPVGMRILAAVAMVGAPSIAVLRWLVEYFHAWLDEALWLRVTALPWFRSGAWPEGLQARLVAWLHATDTTLAGEVAKVATALLVRDEPPAGSAAHLRWELDLAAVRVRAGDRDGARAALRKLGGTALHREVDRRLSGASSTRKARVNRVDRVDRWLRALAVTGAALCVLAGLSLEWSGGAQAAAPAAASSIAETSAGRIQVRYEIRPPDPADAATKDDAPRIEVRVTGAPNLTAAKFTLVDRSAQPRFEMKATARRTFAEGPESVALALVVPGRERWIGNTSYREANDRASQEGALRRLQAGLEKIDFEQLYPPGSVGLLITYDDQVRLKLQSAPLKHLAAALGAEKDYIDNKGAELVKAIELALSELRKLPNQHKLLILISEGIDSNPDAAVRSLPALKELANRDRVQVHVIVYKALDSEPGNLLLDVFPESLTTANTSDNIAVGMRWSLDRVASQQYLTFPGFDRNLGAGFQWDGKPHELTLKIDKEELEPVSLSLAPAWSPDEGGDFPWSIAILGAVLLLGLVAVKVLE